MNTILPRAKQFLEQGLSVIPVSGNLKLERFCPYTIAGKKCCATHSQCTYSETNECYDVNIPSTHESSGVPGTDYILYVTGRPTQGSTIAWAASCRKDQHKRPIAGQANFGPNRINPQADIEEQVSTAIHEMLHALGWSNSHFEFFTKPNGDSYPGGPLQTFYQNGKQVTKLVTPKAIQAVKEHAECASFDNEGVELEDHGGSGTAGPHLEKRLFMNEVMTGTSSNDPTYSRISLAILEDSGWYQVNYAGTKTLKYGNKMGCDYLVR